MEGLSNLSPRRLQKLLSDCHSVKVKRSFLFFADRHQHAWAKRIKKDDIDLGKEKRMLVKGSKLNTRRIRSLCRRISLTNTDALIRIAVVGLRPSLLGLV